MTTTTQQAPAPRYRFVVEGALLWIQIAMGLSFIAVAPLFPLIIDDYGIDNATASLLVGGTALAFAVSTIPGGLIAARFGWWRATFFGGLLMSAMVLSPLASSFTILLGLRLLFAAGGATVMGALPSGGDELVPAARAARGQRDEHRRPEHRRHGVGVHRCRPRRHRRVARVPHDLRAGLARRGRRVSRCSPARPRCLWARRSARRSHPPCSCPSCATRRRCCSASASPAGWPRSSASTRGCRRTTSRSGDGRWSAPGRWWRSRRSSASLARWRGRRCPWGSACGGR